MELGHGRQSIRFAISKLFARRLGNHRAELLRFALEEKPAGAELRWIARWALGAIGKGAVGAK
jgi:hypothetical protein